jgi:hypothetical protein
MREQRRNGRVVPAQKPKGKLMLYVNDDSFEVKSVRDVSPFGIGVCIVSDVEIESEARISYQTGGEDLEVLGIVVWSGLIKGDGNTQVIPLFRIGICLQPDNVASNLEFYRLMKGEN